MVIDIREDVPEMLEYVRQRVDAHLATVSKDKALPPVKMIEFGFEFGQGNWVALVFDTRPDAEPDGEWTRDIDRILLERPKWPIWHKLPDDAQVYFINLAGEKIDVMPNPDELICNIVGDAMKHVLLTAREKGFFKPLPKADKCELGVENMEGYYGWPAYEDRGRENLA
jgi:hypothetical protein